MSRDARIYYGIATQSSLKRIAENMMGGRKRSDALNDKSINELHGPTAILTVMSFSMSPQLLGCREAFATRRVFAYEWLSPRCAMG